MGLLDMLRRRPAIRDAAGLAQFVDEQAAFLVQKGIYEYSRARAGHYAKVLLAEAEFLAVVEQSRWQAYPLGLAMVAEMVAGVLGPQFAPGQLRGIVLSVYDRYPVPAPLGEALWQDGRRDLAHALDAIGLAATKLVKDIPEPFAERYFALMPIHEKLRGRDFPAMRSYLKITLCAIHTELTRRMDAPALRLSLA